MILRLRYRTLGGHVHCRVFLAADVDQTFALCGELVFRIEEDWPRPLATTLFARRFDLDGRPTFHHIGLVEFVNDDAPSDGQ